jgi:uroporphyrinogen-III synthase
MADAILLLTRPLAQSRAFAARFDGLDCVISPMLRIVPILPGLPELTAREYAGLIFTSVNGVLAAAELLQLSGRRAWCVGERTAGAARMAGMQAESAGGAAEDLVALILAKGAGPLLHLRGEHSRGDVAARLTSAGTETDEAIIYQQRAELLTAAARATFAGQRKVILPIFSARTARILSERVGTIHAPVQVIAISEAVAAAWARPGVIVAATPDADAMEVVIRSQLG